MQTLETTAPESTPGVEQSTRDFVAALTRATPVVVEDDAFEWYPKGSFALLDPHVMATRGLEPGRIYAVQFGDEQNDLPRLAKLRRITKAVGSTDWLLTTGNPEIPDRQCPPMNVRIVGLVIASAYAGS